MRWVARAPRTSCDGGYAVHVVARLKKGVVLFLVDARAVMAAATPPPGVTAVALPADALPDALASHDGAAATSLSAAFSVVAATAASAGVDPAVPLIATRFSAATVAAELVASVTTAAFAFQRDRLRRGAEALRPRPRSETRHASCNRHLSVSARGVLFLRVAARATDGLVVAMPMLSVARDIFFVQTTAIQAAR